MRSTRTVDRFAFIFGIVNLVLGIGALLRPTVSHRHNRSLLSRFTRRNRGLINRQPGMLFGGLGAVNPPHAVIHSALGALGLATRRWSGLSRAYMWVMGALFAVMAVVGWATVGTRPGIHNVMGMAVDRNNNILHTIWGIGALLLAAKPMLGQNLAEREYNETINEFNSMV